MQTIILVQPGATDFDEQKRIKGRLDIPLCTAGADQVRELVRQLSKYSLDLVYSAPCLSAQQTSQELSRSQNTRLKTLPALQNVDHGLWDGKLIEEIRRNQPKAYRLWADNCESVCPPEGESLKEARGRVQRALDKILRKHRNGTVAIVVPEPLATLVRSYLQQQQPHDLWESECDGGNYQVIPMTAATVAT